MKIRNVKGSSRVSPMPPFPYVSWIEYWRGQMGYREGISFLGFDYIYFCPICGKMYSNATKIVGGHVAKVDSTDNRWYILPICGSCNKRPGLEAEVPDITNTQLVPMPSNLPK